MSLKGKVAIITGSTRGIGREIAIQLAKAGAKVVITGKTTTPQPNLTGTLDTVKAEIEAIGSPVLAVQVDIRDDEGIQRMVQNVVETWGGIDILVNNASAISVTPTLETSLKKVDLMLGVNFRGTFACSQACIPYLKESDNPHILNLSPPIPVNQYWYKRALAYTYSKTGMSFCTLGMSQELKQWCIAVNSLWPKTTIATAAVKNLFPPDVYSASRTPEIVGKAACGILQENSEAVTGQFFIDEDYLRAQGETNFDQYALDPTKPLQPDLFLDWIPPNEQGS